VSRRRERRREARANASERVRAQDRGGPAPPPELRRLRFAIGAFLSVVLAGFVGYQVVEGAGPLDSLYMTVITITTVGFREVVEVSSTGKVLTILLIVAGVGSASYTALTAAEFVVEGHLRHFIERRRMQREIQDIDGHVIVCGFGRVGRHLAYQLARERGEFVVVDDDEVKIEEIIDLGYLYVRGDATEEQVLEDAGLYRSRAVVASVNSDADNVLVTLTAKGLSPDTVVIARAKSEENEGKLRRAGADRVIAPSTIGGRRIAQILTRPAVADFLDGIGGGGVDYTLEEIPVREGDGLSGRSLKDAGIRERFGCSVLALRHHGEERLDTHPVATSLLEPGDVLVVMGSEDDVTEMRRFFTRR
jgi:voltage-gated potassium channel